MISNRFVFYYQKCIAHIAQASQQKAVGHIRHCLRCVKHFSLIVRLTDSSFPTALWLDVAKKQIVTNRKHQLTQPDKAVMLTTSTLKFKLCKIHIVN